MKKYSPTPPIGELTRGGRIPAGASLATRTRARRRRRRSSAPRSRGRAAPSGDDDAATLGDGDGDGTGTGTGTGTAIVPTGRPGVAGGPRGAGRPGPVSPCPETAER
ncbi:hypothetical protein FRAHR75_390043 [Frankia sp. Hr75.2]|nr:hypothetical protein FRAHR75_390043 [Frankia sp. Hr75.2]